VKQKRPPQGTRKAVPSPSPEADRIATIRNQIKEQYSKVYQIGFNDGIDICTSGAAIELAKANIKLKAEKELPDWLVSFILNELITIQRGLKRA